MRGPLRAQTLLSLSLSPSLPLPSFAAPSLAPAAPAPEFPGLAPVSSLFTWSSAVHAAEKLDSLAAPAPDEPPAPEAAALAADAPLPADPAAAPPPPVDDPAAADSAIAEFRDRLRWLNAVTSAATEELDAIAPPPLKTALEGAVRTVKETDVGPALDVAKRVVGDLQEGFSGLFSAAKDFDAAATTAELKARMEREVEARKAEEEAAATARAEAEAEQAPPAAPAPPVAPPAAAQ